MKRKPAAVQIALESIFEYGYGLQFNPYMWTVFFKVDGSTLSVNAEGNVGGNCVITPSSGSHGDLAGTQISGVTEIQVPPYYIDGYDYQHDTISLIQWSIPSQLG